MRIEASQLMAAGLALCLSLGATPAASAANLSQSIPSTQEIMPYAMYIKDCYCDLSISGRTASINAWVSGQTGVATKCSIRVELQEKAGSAAWTTVKTWSDQQAGTWAEVSTTSTVTPGNLYRLKVTATAWAGSPSEVNTFFSDDMKA